MEAAEGRDRAAVRGLDDLLEQPTQAPASIREGCVPAVAGRRSRRFRSAGEEGRSLPADGGVDLKLVKAVDTHLASPTTLTGFCARQGDRTRCITVMGQQSKVDVVSMRIADGDRLGVEGLSLDVLLPPGTPTIPASRRPRVTGDTLLIRGTGRTDFQNGDSCSQYESLAVAPDAAAGSRTLGFSPAHDYKGDTVSTIGEEKRLHPRFSSRRRRIREADGKPAFAQLQNDGRRRSRQHPPRAASGGCGAQWPGLGQQAKVVDGRGRADRPAREDGNGVTGWPWPLHALRGELSGPYRRGAASFTSSRGRAARSFSTARLRRARRWRRRPGDHQLLRRVLGTSRRDVTTRPAATHDLGRGFQPAWPMPS